MRRFLSLLSVFLFLWKPSARGAVDLALESKVDAALAKLSLEEKIALLHGAGTMELFRETSLIPGVSANDGPQGVRAGAFTAFPSAIAMAATWDVPLLEKIGQALGEETLASGAKMLLGPAINLMRTPLGGRTYEYMGEDPRLAGRMAAAYIRGLQSTGASSCLKHFALNNQESWRDSVSVEIGERALREVYLESFRIAIEEGKPWAVMNAYNRIRGEWCTANAHLNRDILYGVFGFDGANVSDWGAWHDDKKAIEGGCTIEMPSSGDLERDRKIAARVRAGEISEKLVTEAVRRNLRLAFRVKGSKGAANTPEHQALARRLSVESIVLLKNAGSALPLDATKVRRVAVIGPNAAAEHTIISGTMLQKGGSGAVRPPYEITPLQGLAKALGEQRIDYAPGYVFAPPTGVAPADFKNGPAAIEAAVAAAKSAEIAIVFAGTNHSIDHEALKLHDPDVDKKDLELPGPQGELIRRVAAVNPRTIVVLINGAPVRMEDWQDKVGAIVEAWYPGMEGGNAIAEVLLGAADPGGRLPVTFGKNLTDWRVHQLGAEVFPGTGKGGDEKYDDGIWVGYRWFDHAGTEPRYPFGFGLSYTKFEFSNFAVAASKDGWTAKATVKNIGSRAGSEVVQLYTGPADKLADAPVRELKAFQKLHLKPGMSQAVTFTLSPRDFAHWSEKTGDWRTPAGRYRIEIATSSRDVKFQMVGDVRKERSWR